MKAGSPAGSRTVKLVRSILLVTFLFGGGVSCGVAIASEPVGDGLDWWVHLRSAGYAFQTVAGDEGETETGRFGAYQHVQGVVSGLAACTMSSQFIGMERVEMPYYLCTVGLAAVKVAYTEERAAASRKATVPVETPLPPPLPTLSAT